MMQPQRGIVHQRVIIFLGTLRGINLKSNSCRLQRKSIQTKHLGACEEIAWGIFFSPRSLRRHKWKVLPLPGNTLHNGSWGAVIPDRIFQLVQRSLGCRHHPRQDFHSQCFCQSGWTSELLLFNYRCVLATLRQWAFTLVREVIAFTFKAWPNHKSRITDISWKEASFKSL